MIILRSKWRFIMITVYVVGIAAYHESEDIEIRYSIYDQEELLCQKKIVKEYEKPVVVSLIAFMTVLDELENYTHHEINIVVNDAALQEQIKGTSTSKNQDVQRMASKARKKIKKFVNPIHIKDISNDRVEIAKWNSILQP